MDTQEQHPATDGSSPQGQETVDDKHQRFLRLYSANQRQLYAYIGTFIYAAADVSEVAQETSVILWRKFDEFRTDGSFLAWACGVARYEVYRFLRHQNKRPLPLNEELIARLSDERERMQSELDTRRQALERCLTKLREKDRTLVWRCYSEPASFKSIAEELGRPVNSVYKSLGRIRNTLMICIKSTLGIGGRVMIEPLPIEELPRALNELCVNQLSEDDALRLAELLRRYPHARRFYLCYMDLHTSLQWQVNEEHAQASFIDLDLDEEPTTEQILAEIIEQERAAAAEREREAQQTQQAEARLERRDVLPFRHAVSDKPPVRQIIIPKAVAYGALAAVLVLVAMLGVHLLPADRENSVVDADPTPAGVHRVAVAVLVETQDAVWGDQTPALLQGNPIYSDQPIKLVSGKATLRFANQARVVIEGPCELRPGSASELDLDRGKLIVRCDTPQSKLFLVRTPHAGIIDLGTEFGVLVEEDRSAKVFVFEGEIQVTTQEQSENLTGGQAAQVDADQRLALRPEAALAFLSRADLDARRLDVGRYYVDSVKAKHPLAYYRFEEVAGQHVGNEMGPTYPAAVVGGLELDGEQNHAGVFALNYLHVKQPLHELTRGDYTVELWVRPERDAVAPILGFYNGTDPASGRSLWSGVIETGGRFRFLHRSPAGGDIETGNNAFAAARARANRWQHIAAVREGRDLRVYIDGRLSGTAIAPDALTPAPQLILGGGDSGTSPYTRKQAFVGRIDEVAVYDHALPAADIAHHYRLVAGRDAEEATP